uniref:Poly A polymerase head domain-containing protein n=1 Tax=Panagrolaimus davidi TaxID=227884 RepID=A0A914QKA9_9BILA
MAKNWAILSKMKITGLNDTLQGVVESIQREGGCKIYFFGGGIRDAVRPSIHGWIGGDLDASVTCDFEKFKNICIKKYGFQNCFSPKPKTKIIRIGSAKTYTEKKNEIISIDVSSFSGTFDISHIFWEYTINYVVYDPKENILFDMTSRSLDDQCNKEFDIPVSSNQWLNWTNKDGILKALR